MRAPIATAVFVLWSSAALANDPDARFASALQQLFGETIAAAAKQSATSGEYEGASGRGHFYQDIQYTDPATGKTVARLRHARGKPQDIHQLEVYIYDAQGRVVRDYQLIYLPWNLKNPERTFINLHHYNGELHSFRQYDAAGNFLYQQCSGQWEQKKVFLSLEASDVTPEQSQKPVYKACFDALPQSTANHVVAR